MIFLIAASLAFFLEFILISKKGKSLADKILTVWMFVLGAHLLLHFTDHFGLEQNYTILLGLGTPFPLLHGPFLYLYTIALTKGEDRLHWLDYFHFLPVLIVVFIMLPFFFSSPEEKLQFVRKLESQRTAFLTILLYSYMVSGISYIVLSLLALHKHRKNLTANFSYTDRINLNWLRILIFGMIAIWSVVTIGHTLDDAFGMNIKEEVDSLIFLTTSVFILLIGFFGIKQTRIFSGAIPVEAYEAKEGFKVKETNAVRYRKSGLKNAQADELQVRLEKMMKEEKPFLDYNLTLKTLAENLDIHPNYLSQLINECLVSN